MANFMIRFMLCNVFISGIIGILSLSKWVFKNNLSSRMQYNLWFLLLGLLAVPFIPFRLDGFPQFFSWISGIRNAPASPTKSGTTNVLDTDLSKTANWMNDFALSVNRDTPSITGYILFAIWIVGILAMLLFVTKSSLRLCTIKKSALPLQNPEVCKVYRKCLDEMQITRDIPVYSTAFLKSPIIAGFLNPCIYLPIHLISDYHEQNMRYMLLHELQHYKYKDAIANYLMNLARVLYWFNPFVWYALKEMRIDREVACDTSVLKMLEENDYGDYGNTLINFAEKISITPFPFASSLGGTMKQMKRRIINIASYEKPTFCKTIKGITAFILTTILILGLAPFTATYAVDDSHYHWKSSSDSISYLDFSTFFGTYEGSFVLYDAKKEAWHIHDMEHATLRVAPDSTYKIYDALFGLEEGVITPEASLITWNGKSYPFEAWNVDQTLDSAMASSVNWYFQTLDKQIGTTSISDYIQRIGYGNERVSNNLSTYWMDSSLKISPLEQVELLIKLQNKSLEFSSENINAIKDSIRLFSSNTGTLYGKTGTGRVDGQDVNGWFIGFIETSDNAYFFATNICAASDATGSNASEITLSILSDMKIWLQ